MTFSLLKVTSGAWGSETDEERLLGTPPGYCFSLGTCPLLENKEGTKQQTSRAKRGPSTLGLSLFRKPHMNEMELDIKG